MTDPGIAPTNVDNNTVNVNIQHKFNSNWKLTSQLTYVNEYTLGSDIWPSQFLPNGDMIRTLYFWEDSNDEIRTGISERLFQNRSCFS
jgi:iron complex outermembrane receptor protein